MFEVVELAAWRSHRLEEDAWTECERVRERVLGHLPEPSPTLQLISALLAGDPRLAQAAAETAKRVADANPDDLELRGLATFFHLHTPIT